MRRTIRLTGRKQLPVSAFDFQLRDVGGRQVATLAVNPDISQIFPGEAHVRVKLVENKRVAVLRFGTIDRPKVDADTGDIWFKAPSCEVRIVSPTDPEGKLLGSTRPWTHKTDGIQEGILQFQVDNTSPQLWKLEIRESEYPIIYVDERIPDAAVWAGSSPIFSALVLPVVVREVFRSISSQSKNGKPEEGWMAEWLSWANSLMPGEDLPTDDELIDQWCNNMVDTFMGRHGILAQAVAELAR